VIVEEGTRVRLTGRAWGNRGREVYARVTFADHGYAKIDDQEVLASGGMVDGYEFEVAEVEERPLRVPTILELESVIVGRTTPAAARAVLKLIAQQEKGDNRG
jgi:hypothetical protein